MGQTPKKRQEQLREIRERRFAEEQAKKKKENKIILITVVSIAAILLIAGLIVFLTTPKTKYVKLTVQYTTSAGEETTGEIVIKTRPDVAPITSENFTDLVSDGFYDGLTFHRIVEGFMIQGGDPDGNGSGGSGKNIKGEFSANGVNNTLSHKRGVVSMARSNSYNSASSQFFIVNDDRAVSSLDGLYAAFGEVVFGMDVVDGITATEKEFDPGGIDQTPSSPVHPVTILKAEIVDWKE